MLSLRIVADNGHTYTGNLAGVTVFFKLGVTIYFPSIEAIIAPGPTPSNLTNNVNINDLHVAHADTHARALRKTAKEMGVTFE